MNPQRREVVVIGGGLTGCAVARELVGSGARVTLLERGKIGGEASGAAAGILGAQGETEDEHMLHLGAESRRMFPELLRALREEAGIDVEFWRQGGLYLCFSAADEETIQRRSRWQRTLGFDSELVSAQRAIALEPLVNRRLRCATYFGDERRVDNVALTAAYARAATVAGCELREGEGVRAIVVEAGQVTGVETTGSRFTCDVVINTAGAWAGALAVGATLPVTPVRGQMVVVKSRRPPIRHALYSARGYAVSRRDGRVLLGSTRESVGFDKRVTAGGLAGILDASRELAPALVSLPVSQMWAGLRPGTPDGLPIIGDDPAVRGYYVASGHYRDGVLLAPITARLVASLVQGKREPWHDVFRADRFEN